MFKSHEHPQRAVEHDTQTHVRKMAHLEFIYRRYRLYICSSRSRPGHISFQWEAPLQLITTQLTCVWAVCVWRVCDVCDWSPVSSVVSCTPHWVMVLLSFVFQVWSSSSVPAVVMSLPASSCLPEHLRGSSGISLATVSWFPASGEISSWSIKLKMEAKRV